MIKVLIIDDSPLIRRILEEILNQAPCIEVVGSAEDPYQARDMIKALNPDVLTLDVEMPKMNGLSFLKNLMRLRPMPVVMISTLTQHGSPTTIEALELGAVDFISKPKTDVANSLNAYADILVQKITTASRARVRAYKPPADDQGALLGSEMQFAPTQVMAIGASTGGTEAIKEVLVKMPTHCPPIVITQHIPPVFATSFSQRMNKTCTISVKEAADGDILKAGHAYIAPGDKHLVIKQVGMNLKCTLSDAEPVNRHKPAVDTLFDSLVPVAKYTTAAILTGMGSDGAQGLLKLKEAGAKTIAQDEQSCVVWGMPRAAFELGAAQKVVSLDEVAMTMLQSASRR